jgi:hypothetical protein
MTYSYRLRRYQNVMSLDPEMRQRAVEFLRADKSCEECRALIKADRELWWANNGWHYSRGDDIRKKLRKAGFTERTLNVTNLDLVYAGLIELAVMGDQYFEDLKEQKGVGT